MSFPEISQNIKGQELCLPTIECYLPPPRLNVQHVFLRTMVYDGKLIYDEAVKLHADSVILDSGTGTGEHAYTVTKSVLNIGEYRGLGLGSRERSSIHRRNIWMRRIFKQLS